MKQKFGLFLARQPGQKNKDEYRAENKKLKSIFSGKISKIKEGILKIKIPV